MHLFLLLCWAVILEYNLWASELDYENPTDLEPLVFELQDAQYPKQVIDTPEDARVEEDQTEANFLSDKNSIARNEATNPDLDVDSPFAKGDLDVLEVPTNPGQTGIFGRESEEQELSNEIDSLDEDDLSPLYASNASGDFKREFLLKATDASNAGTSDNTPQILYNNQNSQSRDVFQYL